MESVKHNQMINTLDGVHNSLLVFTQRLVRLVSELLVLGLEELLHSTDDPLVRVPHLLDILLLYVIKGSGLTISVHCS